MSELQLQIENLGPFQEKKLNISNNFVVILEPTAAGKTTIARVLHSFLTGNVDISLLSTGRNMGKASLKFKNKEYKLVISKESGVKVDKILNDPYANYLVLTEGTDLYSFYASPPKAVDLDELVKRFVPPPPELVQLESSLRQAETKTVDVDKMTEELNKNLNSYKQRLQALEEELKRVEAELAKAIDVSKVKAVLEKKELEEKVKRLEERSKKISNELIQVVASLQANYEELKEKRKELADKVERLYRRLYMLDAAVKALEKIKEGLSELRDTVDVLAEFDVLLFGQFISSDTVDVFLNDITSGIETLTAKRAELRAEISKTEAQLTEVDKILTTYINNYQRMEALETERNKIERELSELRYRLQLAERKVKEITQALGMSEEEILKRATETGDVSKLLQRKQELLSEIEGIKISISDLEKKIEATTIRKDEALKTKAEYEELKKKYDAVKNKWNQQKQLFKKVFKSAYMEIFTNISIPDFDPESMTIFRPPHTYSQGERLLMAIAYQYALLSALKAIGYDIPMVVIDIVAPTDSTRENEIIRVYKNFDAIKIILKTADTSEIRTIL